MASSDKLNIIRDAAFLGLASLAQSPWTWQYAHAWPNPVRAAIIAGCTCSGFRSLRFLNGPAKASGPFLPFSWAERARVKVRARDNARNRMRRL